MKLHREIDYHGSRRYGSSVAPGLFGLMMAWLGEIAKSRLRKRRSRPASAAVLLHNGQRNFSLLGTDARGADADCPFPLKKPIADRDWRALP